jgi:hypothetical protein
VIAVRKATDVNANFFFMNMALPIYFYLSIS